MMPEKPCRNCDAPLSLCDEQVKGGAIACCPECDHRPEKPQKPYPYAKGIDYQTGYKEGAKATLEKYFGEIKVYHDKNNQFDGLLICPTCGWMSRSAKLKRLKAEMEKGGR